MKRNNKLGLMDSELRYLSNRRLKKGSSSRVGDAVKNSSVSPTSGRPLDPGGSLGSRAPPSLHPKTKRSSKVASAKAASAAVR